MTAQQWSELIGLTITEEASRQLDIAEAGYKKLMTIPPSAKKPIGDSIAILRAKLATEKGPATDEVAGP